MRKPAIAFENLRAEMARGNIGVQDMAECWGCNWTIVNKVDKQNY